MPVPRAILPPWIKPPRGVEFTATAESDSAEKRDRKTPDSITEERSDKKKDRTVRVTSPEEKAPDQGEYRIFADKSHERERKKDAALSRHENKSADILEREAIDHRFDHTKPHFEKPSKLAEKEAHSIAAGFHEGNSPDSRHDYSYRPHIGEPSWIGGRETQSMVHHSRHDYAAQQPVARTPQLIEKNTHSAVAAGTENRADDSGLEYSKRPRSEKKSWLGEKDTHLIVTGLSENALYPISYETSGLACVTPENSDESFFAKLNLAGRRKTYPRGRENLSRNWQEWLRVADEEFIKVGKVADQIIDSIKDTLKLVGPEISCDACCSCRQTRKANIKYHKTKTPRAVIDSVAVDGTKKK